MIKRNPRCKFTIREEQKMIRLYKNGLSLSQVGKEFHIHSSRVYKIFKANNFPCRYHGDGTRLLHEHLTVNSPNGFPWHLHEKFSKLLAVFLLTDGHMRRDGGIMLICTDELLQNYFLTLIKEAYGLVPTIHQYMRRGKDTIVNSTKASSKLFALSPSYKTCPWNDSKEKYFQGPQPSLSFLENEEIDVLKEVIRIAMSTDGTVTAEFQRNIVYPKLEFACAHPILIKEWQKIFTRIGIKTFLQRSNITWSKVKSLGIKELKSVRRFIEIGGFVDGVKITGKSRYYAGIAKNDLLNLLFTLNEHSFQFPDDISIMKKNYVLKGMIINPGKREKWWKIGVDGPVEKKKLDKETIKKEILNFVQKETKNGNFPTYVKLRDQFKRDPENYFDGGMKEIYQCAGVKTKKEVMGEKILDYVRSSMRNHHFPSYDEICQTLHINLNVYFPSIVEVYKRAEINYPHRVKRKAKKPFRTRAEGREAIKMYLLDKMEKGVYPLMCEIENDVRVKFYSYFQSLRDAYAYANIKRE